MFSKINMMSIGKVLGCLLISVISANHCKAQETSEENASLKGKLGISVVMGHAFIKNIDIKKNEITSAAALGLNANYWISNKFVLGVHSDMIFESFIIEEKNGEEENNLIEREYPLSINAVATYKPLHYLGLLAGAGKDFSKEKDFSMFLIGAEYMVEIPHDWELGLSATYEVKCDAYDTFVVGLGLTKIFSFRENHHL